jgi:hypothetical protein
MKSLSPEQKKRVEKLCQALESGQYKQLKGSLRGMDNERCCLGVACEIYIQDIGGGWKGSRFLGEKDVLPQEVRDYFGFNNKNPALKRRTNSELAKCAAAEVNDDGVSFNDIAAMFRWTYLQGEVL